MVRGLQNLEKGWLLRNRLLLLEPIKALYNELRRDVDATPRELSEAIYGDSKAATLRNIGNDASKLTEVLTGSRNLPGFRAPSVAVTEAILGNILSPGNGWFSYRGTMKEDEQ